MYVRNLTLVCALAGVLSLTAMSACGGAKDECTVDVECQAGTFCNNGKCASGCKRSSECENGEFCDRTGRCRPVVMGDDEKGGPSLLDGGPLPNPDESSNPCGNGKIDPGEECDLNNLNGQTCQKKGFASGVLKCNKVCRFDETGCVRPTCGNGKIDQGEQCDGTALNNQTCQTRGFSGGTLKCTACWFDTSTCSGRPCGNGKLDPGEECDGSLLNSQTCVSRGFAGGGTLSCTAQCLFNTSACSATKCGNGKADQGEECDGADLNSQTCKSKGFSGGYLGCTTQCRFDTSGCSTGSKKAFGQPCAAQTECNNGLYCVKLEQSDPTGYCSAQCSTAQACPTTPAGAQCLFKTSSISLCGWRCGSGGAACPPGLHCIDFSGTKVCSGTGSGAPNKCGNGAVDPGEDCDKTDLNNQKCTTRGFTGGTLKCTSQCRFDTSACTGTGTKKGFGQLCSDPQDCATGLVCVVTTSGDQNGYCAAKCSSTQPCPSTPAGARCILKTSSSDICGWACTPGGAACPTGLNCVAFGSGHICSGGAGSTPAKCNNGQVESGEECDGSDLGGGSCQKLGYSGGTLKCTSSCRYDTAACTGTPAKPGFGKSCSGSSGCTSGMICVTFSQNNSYCTAICSSSSPCPGMACCKFKLQDGRLICGWPTSGGQPPVCGNGVLEAGEECDGNQIGDTCKGLGYTGGTLKCTSGCKFDKSSCTGTTKCPNLPPRHCTTNCCALVQFTPQVGNGYQVYQADVARRDLMTHIKYTTAAVACLHPGTPRLGLGDMSMSGGQIPATASSGSCSADTDCGSSGYECRSGKCWRLHHPKGTHVGGHDVDVAYYQKNQPDNRLRAVCPHTSGGQEAYHCTGKPTILEATRTTLFLSKILDTGQVRVIGVDGQVGPILQAEAKKLYQAGMISKHAYDKMMAGAVTFETTNQGRGWYLFHHHHAHISFH